MNVRGVRDSQDNPRTARVTPAYQDTLPQGCWGARKSQDNPGTADVTLAYRDTLPQGPGTTRCNLGFPDTLPQGWWGRLSLDNPGTASVTCDSTVEVGTKHGTIGHPLLARLLLLSHKICL